MLKEQIAADLEVAFAQYGFAEPSVSQLKTACKVSLRTLYKHYPSKEEMIVGALNHRHQRYLAFLAHQCPQDGLEAILHIFDQLAVWMAEAAPNGCMSMNALAAFPDNPLVREAVASHKLAVRDFLAQRYPHRDDENTLFVLHEGISNSWPIIGQAAVDAAKNTLIRLQEENR
ncbi:TetR/AcrR family transcriptional regulator [Thaumasiovibrio subtropicus]|uniref:TetR/AcrR family transcriptional regulator n=1 Tax=Thaumasiovibrio subtropicus TaxID=1891207 RepID=UPI000B34B9C5|nr:TetR/AcrR family transcriptional regulator [Thaumasiovibrio subtropicus]